MDNHTLLTPFDMHSECPPDDQKLIHPIMVNLKINLFHETETKQHLTLFRNHLSPYIPAILLTTDQFIKKLHIPVNL